jgi:predicted phosphodiesterase
MRIAILSDIHSNQHAFEAVLADAREKSVDKFYCLGDIVGYGAFPRKCLEIARATFEKIVHGNHEQAITYPGVAGTFSPAAQSAIKYADSALDKLDKDFIKSLEPHLILDGLTIAHGSLRDFNEYVHDADIAGYSLARLTNKVLFIGHTHVPGGYSFDIESGITQPMELSHEGQVELSGNMKYLINAGSVGQPRDGDPRAAYVIYNTETFVVDLIRVKYDNLAASRAIRKSFLPESLAKRLLTGK